MRLLIIIGLIICSLSDVFAQRPKLYLKAFAGTHWHNFIYREQVKNADNFFGWQGGFGFRVSHRHVFGEVDFDFVRSGITAFLDDSVGQVLEADKLELKLNAFELPLKFGCIPYKSPFFKWYVYSGFAFRFNTKTKVNFGDNEFTFKPRDLNLANPNVDWLLGTQFDVGWVNIDVTYGLGITNSTKTDIRTNSHELQLNLGFLF